MENTTINLSDSAFETFKPVCVTLLRDHTLNNVRALQKLLEVPHDPVILQQLQEYIIFPLRVIQKKSPNKCETFRTEVVKCLAAVLNLTEVNRFEMFQDIFMSLCLSLSSTDPQIKVATVCEELKLALVQCLSALLNCSSARVLESVYEASFLPPLGHAVSLLLHLAETERMRQLRLASIACVQDLAILKRKVPTKLVISAADMFASFLPGISISMTKIATGDIKQGHLITKAAIETWCQIVILVLGDKHLKKVNKPVQEETESGKGYQKLVIIRNEDWITTTTQKLKILVTKIVPIANDSNWRVRLAMVEWADGLLTNCTKSLEMCTSDLLDVLVSRIGDEYEKVSGTSQQALANFQKANITNSKTLVEILENSLHVLATNLPRLIRTSDDDAKLAHLCLFNGYLRLLGPHMSSLLKSYTHLQHLSAALLQVLELDCSGVAIIQEKTPEILQHDPKERGNSGWVKKNFKHFVDERIVKELIKLCHLIGYYGELDIVVDHFLERYMQSSLHRKQAAFILTEVLLGCSGQDLLLDVPTTYVKDHETLLHSIRMITDEYLQLEHWNLTTSNQSDEDDDLLVKKDCDWLMKTPGHHWMKQTGLTIEQINSNVLQICLQLEGLAGFAKVLGNAFEPLLMDILYPVLEKLGDSNNSVSQTAYAALCCISEACKYSSVQELILANADYLVNSISLRMRHLVCNPKAPLVLKVTVMYSNKDILPLIDDTVTEIFESLDSHYGEKALMFVQVLHTLVVSIRKWFPAVTSAQVTRENNTSADWRIKAMPSESETDTNNSLQEIGAFFMDYLRQRHIVETLEVEDTEMRTAESCVRNETEDDVEVETTVKHTPPKHVLIVKQVMDRCVHLLSSPDVRLRLLVLDTIAQCSMALQAHKDELLPMIHKVWPPFLLKFTDEEKLVIIKAYCVLKVLADTSGDFIRQRVVKDIIPRATDCLHKLMLTSMKAGPAYRFSVACRLQLSILQHLGSLCSQINLASHQVGPILEASLPYLSSKQHPILQQAAVEAWRNFTRLYPDYVWLLLNDVYSPQMLNPPHDCFKTVKIGGSRSRNEFSDNIKKVLNMGV